MVLASFLRFEIESMMKYMTKDEESLISTFCYSVQQVQSSQITNVFLILRPERGDCYLREDVHSTVGCWLLVVLVLRSTGSTPPSWRHCGSRSIILGVDDSMANAMKTSLPLSTFSRRLTWNITLILHGYSRQHSTVNSTVRESSSR